VKRGEVWWALIDQRCPVVLLTGESDPELRAVQIVVPATAQQRHGFTILSGEQAADPDVMRQVIASTGTDMRGVGVEVEIGTDEGLPRLGVIRVALPQQGHIFCTWLVTLTRESLLERAGVLPSVKLDQLAAALRLAQVEQIAGVVEVRGAS
jgi:mRNA interferase MazF